MTESFPGIYMMCVAHSVLPRYMMCVAHSVLPRYMMCVAHSESVELSLPLLAITRVQAGAC